MRAMQPISVGHNESSLGRLETAAACGIRRILLTGAKPGKCAPYADLVLAVPETETYKIQELHLPVYHTLCMIAEAHVFGEEERR